MRQAQRKKEKDKVAIALMLAFCVIALTSIFTIKSNIEKIIPKLSCLFSMPENIKKEKAWSSIFEVIINIIKFRNEIY